MVMMAATWSALNTHARSTRITSVAAESGELHRVRLSGAAGDVVSYLRGLRQPVRAWYEAGPTGFRLAREARAAGIDLVVIAPSKTPRARHKFVPERPTSCWSVAASPRPTTAHQPDATPRHARILRPACTTSA